MSNKKLTQEQFDDLQRIFSNGDRTGYYIKYYEYTGNDQSLEMAEISSFSGWLGGTAEMANIIAAQLPGYPKEGVIKFSEEIATAHFNFVKTQYNDGKSGYLEDHEVIDIAKNVWESKGIGHLFPGNPEYFKEKILAGKFKEAFNDPKGLLYGGFVGLAGKVGHEATFGVFTGKGPFTILKNSNNYESHITHDYKVQYFTDKTTGKTVYVEETGVKKVGNNYIITGISDDEVAARLNIPKDRVIENYGVNVDAMGRPVGSKSFTIIPEKTNESTSDGSKHDSSNTYTDYTSFWHNDLSFLQMSAAYGWQAYYDAKSTAPNNDGPGPRRKDDGDKKGPGDNNGGPKNGGPFGGPGNGGGPNSGGPGSFDFKSPFKSFYDYKAPVFNDFKPSYVNNPLFSFETNFGSRNLVNEPSWLYGVNTATQDSFKFYHAKQEFKESVKACLGNTFCSDRTSDLLSKTMMNNYGLSHNKPFTFAFEMHRVAEDAAREWVDSQSKISLFKKNYSLGSWSHPLREELKYAASHVSPLVLDLNGDGVKLFPYTKGVYFDIDNDGFAERVGWVSPEDGQLARDINDNGQIDNITELFGDDVISAFFKLSLLDTNNDKVIDKNDENFEELLIWQDKNSNGFSEPGELTKLKDLKIKSISLNTTADNRVIEGNLISEISSFTYEDGKEGEVADVHYHNDDMDSWFKGSKPAPSIKQGQFTEELKHFRAEILKEIDEKLKNTADIDSNKDWLAEVIKLKVNRFIEQYKAKSEADIEALLNKANENFAVKKINHVIHCTEKQQTLIDDANKTLKERKAEAKQKLLDELTAELQQEKETINSKYTQEYHNEIEPLHTQYQSKKDTYIEGKNNELKQAKENYSNSLNERIKKSIKDKADSLLNHFQSIHGTQAQYDQAVEEARNKIIEDAQNEYNTYSENIYNSIKQEVNNKIDEINSEHEKKKTEIRDKYVEEAEKERVKAAEKYTEKFKQEFEKIEQRLLNEEISKLAYNKAAEAEECVSENLGIKTVITEEVSAKNQASKRYIDALTKEIQKESNNIYNFIIHEVLSEKTSEEENDVEAFFASDVDKTSINYLNHSFDKYKSSTSNQTISDEDYDSAALKIDPETLFMPIMRGYGKLPALHIAMTHNSDLKDLVLNFIALKPQDFSNIYERVATILYEWAGIGSINEDLKATAGGANIEARKVLFVEQITGQKFKQLGAADFVGQHASTAVQKAWDIAYVTTLKNLLVQGPLIGLFPKAEYSFVEDIIRLNSSFEEILSSAKELKATNKLDYDFWVQLGYILASQLTELNTTIENLNSRLSELAGEPINIDTTTLGLIGNNLNNIIKGTSGSDYINGLGGNDKLYGKEGSDHLEGGEGDDELYGGQGIDRMHGGNGNDKMYGNENRDFMYGDEGNDEMYGEDGDDHIEGGEGADNMDGGNGTNTISYGSSKEGVSVNLATKEASGGDASGDKFSNFQNIGGSEFDDQLKGDDSENYINGEGGNDHIYGGKGDDDLFGAKGEDHLYGEEGDDTLSGFEGPDHMDGGEGKDTASYHHPYSLYGVNVDLSEGKGTGGHAHEDTYTNIENVIGSKHDDSIKGNNEANILRGMEGDDILHGEDGDDVLIGGTGNNKLFGGEGNDRAILGFGSDEAFGGAGEDTISYVTSPAATKIDMAAGEGSTFIHHVDKFDEFENAEGSNYDDTILGDDQDNKLIGLDGNDHINGRDGNDTILPGRGDDNIEGGEGDDYIFGDEGNDDINGNEGKDTVDYSKEDKESIVINLSNGVANGGFAEGDILTNIENIIGTKFDDYISGDDNGNFLYGFDGDDKIYGGAGNDVLKGGKGNNKLFGEAGHDQFIAGEGTDTMDGGIGFDYAIYTNSNEGVNVNLVNGEGISGDAEGDRYVDIEGVVGSKYNDTLTGNDLNNDLNGIDGDDNLYGQGGNDILNGGDGQNNLYGGEGDDHFYTTDGSNNIEGGEGKDTIDYSAYRKDEYFAKYDVEFYIREQNRVLPLSPQQRFSDPVFEDNEGFDIDLTKGSIFKKNGLADNFTSVENIIGSHFNDNIYGNDENNILNGLNGNDKIYGGKGNDTLIAGYGVSELYGEEGNDQFVVYDPRTKVDGGEGHDGIDFAILPEPIIINLKTSKVEFINSQANATIVSIESARGSAFDDIIYDDENNNIIEGNDGDDEIHLTSGNDKVYCGNGHDYVYLEGAGNKILYGDDGEDRYIITEDFFSSGENTTIIADFNIYDVRDTIDLTAFPNIRSINDIEITNYTEHGLLFTKLKIAEDKEINLFNWEKITLVAENLLFFEL
jgi:Ca2+-binding RTX toxin-like protein